MKDNQKIQVLDRCKRLLEAKGFPEMSDYNNVIGKDEKMGYLIWMSKEAKNFIMTGDKELIEKALVWLGFVQGCLWLENVLTIDEMRDHNRSVD